MKKLEKNRLEWAVFAVSLLMVTALLGFLSYRAVTVNGRPPEISITLGPAEQRGGQYYVPVTLENRSDRTVEAVHVEVRMADETAELDVPFLPHRSKRHGEVTFSRKPAGPELQARVLGYYLP